MSHYIHSQQALHLNNSQASGPQYAPPHFTSSQASGTLQSNQHYPQNTATQYLPQLQMQNQNFPTPRSPVYSNQCYDCDPMDIQSQSSSPPPAADLLDNSSHCIYENTELHPQGPSRVSSPLSHYTTDTGSFKQSVHVNHSGRPLFQTTP